MILFLACFSDYLYNNSIDFLKKQLISSNIGVYTELAYVPLQYAIYSFNAKVLDRYYKISHNCQENKFTHHQECNSHLCLIVLFDAQGVFFFMEVYHSSFLFPNGKWTPKFRAWKRMKFPPCDISLKPLSVVSISFCAGNGIPDEATLY